MIKKVFLAIAICLALVSLDILISQPDQFDYQPEVFKIETSTELPKNELTKLPVKHTVKKVQETKTVEVIFLSERERSCLIRNVFFEAGNESHEGKIAVAQVTWNRVKSKRWGQDFCQVVYAPGQFNWTTDPDKMNAKISNGIWTASIQAVDDFVAGARVTKVEKGFYFHARHVVPDWNRFALRIAEIGNHVFYSRK